MCGAIEMLINCEVKNCGVKMRGDLREIQKREEQEQEREGEGERS